MGLGEVKENNTVFLTIAGGYIWNKKIEEGGKNFAKQEYTKPDGSTEYRKGAQYADLTGEILKVAFPIHEQWGEFINVTIDAGDESPYIISIGTNNKYSQDMMKALLLMDLNKPLFMKPYDFSDSEGKRCQGISFRQDGEKIKLRVEIDNEDLVKDADWFKDKSPKHKKEIKRYFEDLNEWYVAKVQEEVCPILAKKTKTAAPKKEVETPSKEEQVEEKVESKKVKVEEKVTPLKMKRFLKTYISENYEDQTLPELDTKELKIWYDLGKAEKELPFDNIDEDLDSIDDLLK